MLRFSYFVKSKVWLLYLTLNMINFEANTLAATEMFAVVPLNFEHFQYQYF